MNDHELENERIEEFLKNETPLRKKEGQIYSSTAKKFFSKIKTLRGRGFSFFQICEAFEKAGFLPEKPNPYSFRQAFVRESARQDRADELLREIKNDLGVEKKEKIQSEAHVMSHLKKTTETHSPAPRTSGLLSTMSRAVGNGTGLEVKPDNTFTIRPIDPGDLPEI